MRKEANTTDKRRTWTSERRMVHGRQVSPTTPASYLPVARSTLQRVTSLFVCSPFRASQVCPESGSLLMALSIRDLRKNEGSCFSIFKNISESMDRRQDAAVHRFCEGSFVRKARWHVHGTGPQPLLAFLTPAQARSCPSPSTSSDDAERFDGQLQGRATWQDQAWCLP